MITKKELADWLNESARKDYEKKLEEFIDGFIKRNAIAGKTTFYIPTGEWTEKASKKTKFYELWYTEELSDENRKIVRDRVLNKYREFGFDVKLDSVDCGWNNHFFALLFRDIDKVIKEESK